MRNVKQFLSLSVLLFLSSLFIFINQTSQAAYGPVAPHRGPLERGFFAEGNIGFSRTHDHARPAARAVNNRGVGWGVIGGYQFFRYLAGEMGYTHYGDAEHTTAGVRVATNEHYSIHGAAKLILPFPFYSPMLQERLRGFGKIGLAYVRAKKAFAGAGPLAIRRAVNVYFGGGVDFALSRNVRLVAQASEAVGNRRTGSTDLYSIGVNFMVG